MTTPEQIFYIANVRLPTEKAHGIQIMKMCEAMSAHTSVTLVVPQRTNVLSEQDPFVYYGVSTSFHIVTLPCADPTWLMRLPGGIYIKLQGWLFGRAVRTWLRQQSPAVLYTRDQYLLSTLQQTTWPTVWEGHDWPGHARRYVECWKKCVGIVTITKALAQQLVGAGVRADQIMVAPDGVDLALFTSLPDQATAREQLGLPTDKKIAMYSGHLYGWKGIDTVVAAAAQLPNDVQMLVVGGTDTDIAHWKSQTTQTPQILFVGRVPANQVPLYLTAADLLVLPNSGRSDISRYYTSPLKLFEYLAAGKPIVASDLPSIREILSDNNAWWFTSDDAGSLTQAIQTALSDPARCGTMANNNQQLVQQYTWQKRAKNIIDFTYAYLGRRTHL